MKNKQYKRLLNKALKLVIATAFSFSLVNSTLVAKFTDINEFDSVAFANQGKGKGNSGGNSGNSGGNSGNSGGNSGNSGGNSGNSGGNSGNSGGNSGQS